MNKVYVVLDNDMENSMVTVDVYATLEDAREAAKEILAEVKDQYDEVLADYDDEWTLLDADVYNRVISVQESEIKTIK